MLDKPYRRVRQPLKTEIFMLVWMSTESIHNDRLSSVGSSALGREPLPILLWSKVSQGVCGTLFVEESNIFGDLPRDIICRCDVQICKQLGLYPSVDGFHGGIVRWRASSGHGSSDVIHGQEFVVAFGSVYRASVTMKDKLLIRILLLELDDISQTIEIGHTIAALGRKRLCNQLIIP